MIVAIESLLPSLLLIGLGSGLVRTAIMSREGWEGVERLNYYLLYPVLLFVSVVRADLRSAPVFSAGAAMALGVATVAALMIVSRRLWPRLGAADGPAFTSHLQGAIRYNTAVALAVSGALFGAEGLALAALGAVARSCRSSTSCASARSRHGPPPRRRGPRVWRRRSRSIR
ncbi:hypothetical protein [Chenggangzhangella methanolivorans]|uniref:hypothetical protein n=1 Tax=Chenggangzhangella methanolivorans TaxID=1437009 RepID=UPI0021BDC08F|nr:hypothetical protein [Chenggangzhangella methanolivorans]